MKTVTQDILDTYRRIDDLPSVSQMRDAVATLRASIRRAVILYALEHSRFQFQWSWFAQEFGIPEGEWPERVS